MLGLSNGVNPSTNQDINEKTPNFHYSFVPIRIIEWIEKFHEKSSESVTNL
jgi:hypothetical protein